jgi:hypothetical protein
MIDIFLSEPLEIGEAFGIVLNVCLVLSFFVLGYRGMLQGSIFQQQDEGGLSANSTYMKYASSGLTKEAGPIIADLLQKCMTETRPHLTNDLTLAGLAKIIGVSTHHLSQVINEQFGRSFFDFINQFRVQEAETLK